MLATSGFTIWTTFCDESCRLHSRVYSTTHVPIFINAANFFFSAVRSLFAGPTKENGTVRRVEARLRQEERIDAQRRRNERDARQIEEERKRYADKMAANQRRLEEIIRGAEASNRQNEMRLRQEARALEEMRQLNERLEQRNQRAVNRQIQADEAAIRRNQENEIRRKKEEEEEMVANFRQQNEEEKRKLVAKMEMIKKREQSLQAEIDKAKKMVEQERVAREMAENGLQPLRWPSRREFQRALEAVQYSDRNFHFAIVGRAGSGKSSLINAFRNLRNKDRGAAPTGTKETTLEIGRYPDPGDQPPRQWTVWFDIPGAGTQRIPHWEYFNKQGLFVFDIIILAVGDRFEEIDVRILENCARFKVPAFIVRSKADMHILNSMKEYEDYQSIDDDQECYFKCRDEFITETQQTVSEGLKRAGLPEQPVYIVSRNILRETYNGSLERSGLPKGVIHEENLVHDLICAASQRRCDTEGTQGSNPEQTPLDRVKLGFPTFTGRFESWDRGQATEESDLASPFPVAEENQTVRNTGVVAAKIPRGKNHQQQPIHPNNQCVKKVIYPHRPTSVQELQDELAENNPELPAMFAYPPRMFAPKVALLIFYPMALVPQEVHAFGRRLPLVDYKGKGNKEGTYKESAPQTPPGVARTQGTHTRTPETARSAGQQPQDNPRSTRKAATYIRAGEGMKEEMKNGFETFWFLAHMGPNRATKPPPLARVLVIIGRRGWV